MLAAFPDILGIADLYLHRRCGPVLTENRKCCAHRKAQPRRVPAMAAPAQTVCRVGTMALSLPCPPSSVPLPCSHGHTEVRQLLLCSGNTSSWCWAGGVGWCGTAHSGSSPPGCSLLDSHQELPPHLQEFQQLSPRVCISGRSWFCGASVTGRAGTRSRAVCGKQCWR